MLLFLACCGLAALAWEFIIEGPSWYLEGKEANKDLTWADFVKECGMESNRATVNRAFDYKFKNVVVEWEGRVLRVDGDHADDEDDPDLLINDKKHYRTHNAAEILVRMDPALKGLFFSSDYDLLLVLDSEHFLKNQDSLDRLRVGSDIKFKGFLKNLGKVEEQYRQSRSSGVHRSNSQANLEDFSDEFLMPMFTVFDLDVVRLDDELPTEGYNRKTHHHLHKDMRYSVKKD